MRLFTFKPITLLLSYSVGDTSTKKKNRNTVIIIINNILSLVGIKIVDFKRQQKRIGLLFIKNILQYILVGKDKSVVITCNKLTPTVCFSPNYYG